MMPPTIADGATPRITQMNYLLQHSSRTSENSVKAKFAEFQSSKNLRKFCRKSRKYLRAVSAGPNLQQVPQGRTLGAWRNTTRRARPQSSSEFRAHACGSS